MFVTQPITKTMSTGPSPSDLIGDMDTVGGLRVARFRLIHARILAVATAAKDGYLAEAGGY